MTLNLVDLLFLHGMLKNFYNSEGVDDAMKTFLHDIILMFEMYIDQSELPENLVEKFNYEPL